MVIFIIPPGMTVYMDKTSNSEDHVMTYTPRVVNDRVQYKEHEGWVYCITDEYFTLEVATTLNTENKMI